MAFVDDAKADGLPDEVIAEIEGAQEGEGGEGGDQPEAPVTIKISRRKKEQEERDARLKAAEERAADAVRQLQEISSRSASETAHLRGTLEQFQRQFTASQQQNQLRAQEAEPLEERISRERKAADAALKSSDLGEYQARMEKIMDLRSEARVQAIIAAQPRPQAPTPTAPQKPAWVTAIEFQYPDVLSHPRGQQTVGIVDQLLTSEAWGPERLHKAFSRARSELGLKTAPAPSNSQRALHTSIQSSGTGGGGRRGGDGSESVKVPREYLAMARQSGMTNAQAAKAWKDSYPDEG